MSAEQTGWLPAVPRETPNRPGLTIEVAGVPAPQGSLRAFRTKKGGIVVTGDNPKTRPWKGSVTAEASLVVAAAGLLEPAYERDPVGVRIVFRLPRPKAHFGVHGLLGSAPQYPATTPDLDKLARAVLDALTGVIWRDDSQVVRLAVVKRYADPKVVTTIGVEVA